MPEGPLSPGQMAKVGTSGLRGDLGRIQAGAFATTIRAQEPQRAGLRVGSWGRTPKSPKPSPSPEPMVWELRWPVMKYPG